MIGGTSSDYWKLGIKMRQRAVLIGLIALFSASLSGAQDKPDLKAALTGLQAAKPKVSWDEKTAVSADVTCDGKPDTAVIGYEEGFVWLGVIPGYAGDKQAKPMTFRFTVGKDTQDSFCRVPVRIKTSAIGCKTEDFDLPGCKAVKGCSALSLIDEACDAFHFYWNSSRKRLTWWRR
ncbi:MAG: hypothetical protein E6H44_07605 [Betaproteobacteria bacterium]|nr:MAG: hypothetical protein E6H44_07605 [Betaproteobacteria bacterium]